MTIAGDAVDRRGTGDQAVGRRALDQLLARAPALLGGEHQRSVLDEAAGVDEVVEVLARGAAALLVGAWQRRPGGRRRGSGRGGVVTAAEVVAAVLVGGGLGWWRSRSAFASPGTRTASSWPSVDGVADRDVPG